jgi:hypothetical protein
MKTEKERKYGPEGRTGRNTQHIGGDQGILKKTLVSRTGGGKCGTYQGGSHQTGEPDAEDYQRSLLKGFRQRCPRKAGPEKAEHLEGRNGEPAQPGGNYQHYY